MNITVEDKAREFIEKKGRKDVHVYLKGCSS